MVTQCPSRVPEHELRRPVARTPPAGCVATSVRRRPRRTSGCGSGPRDPLMRSGRDPEVAGGDQHLDRDRGAPGQRVAQPGEHVGAVEVDAVRWCWSGGRAPRGGASVVGSRRRSTGRSSHWRRPQTSSGSQGSWKSQTYQLCRTCGSSRSRPRHVEAHAAEVVERRSAGRGVRRHPTLEPRVPGLGGEHVPAGDGAPVVGDEVHLLARRKGGVEHGDQVLDEHARCGTTRGRSACWIARTRARRR